MTICPVLKTALLLSCKLIGNLSLRRWQIFTAMLCIVVSGSIYAEDIRSDATSPTGDIIIDTDSLTPAEQRKAVAMAAFARLFMKPSAAQAKDSLYTALENDPEARMPLKIAIFSLSKSSDADELLIRMVDIAKHNPRALAINLAVIAYLCDHKKWDESQKIAEFCLEAFDSPEAMSENELAIYANIIALRGLIYAKKLDFENGEDFFDSLLGDRRLRRNFTVMKAAVLFFSAAGKQSNRTPFLWFWESDRERIEHKSAGILRRMSVMVGSDKQLGVLSGIYEMLNMPERAESILVDYLIEHSKSEPVMLMLAKMLTRNKDSRALLYWKTLVKVNPNSLLYLRQAGDVAWQEEYIDDAADYFQLYLKKRPEDRTVGLRLSMIYMAQGKLDQALVILEKQPSSFYILQGIGVIKLRRGDYRGALVSFEKAAALLPADKQSLFFCLNMLVAADYSGNVETVKKYAGIIERNFPKKIADYGNALGYTLANNNIELELAEKLLRKALKIAPDRLEILDSMAWLLYRKKRYNEALKYIKLSLKVCGEYPHAVIADHAGDIYLALGNRLSALKYWRVALGVFSVDLDRTAVRNKIAKYTIQN
jgi:tetratricopeptide (TPR) repeat protein